ncbi:MAG: fructose-1,6-bisphosphatase [Clostridiales bacterium]|nr:fructose-1,6-bisphosphatase [Clostridiales bacterium]
MKKLVNEEEIMENIRFLKQLAKSFPTQEDAMTEIVNLSSILALPKSTEHFMSDLHGQGDAFEHILNNCSGVIRNEISRLFKDELSFEEMETLATIVYYPRQKIALELQHVEDKDGWFKRTLRLLIQLGRKVSSKYTRSRVRKNINPRYAYIIEELLTARINFHDLDAYYDEIFDSIIRYDYAENVIVALTETIKRLAVERMHIVGDIYDRGPEPHRILDLLLDHPSVDIQWGNHDILWMGAAMGDKTCISGVLTNSFRHGNLELIEDVYGINLRHLLMFAQDTYKSALVFRPRKTSVDAYYDNPEVNIRAKLHKAIFVIMHKLEGQMIKRNPNFKLDHRLLLEGINKEHSTITIEGVAHPIKDADFPTIDPKDPYKLTDEEQTIIDELQQSFIKSPRLQRHMRFFIERGSMYLVVNNNLLYHALVPMNEDGSFKDVELGGVARHGKELFDYLDSEVKRIYHLDPSERTESELDLMWYLWCGPDSPFFGKNKMTTFERVEIDDSKTHKEKRNAYYSYQDTEDMAIRIMHEFGIENTENSVIVNGHIPVEKINGENPIKANGKLIVIDGGFSRYYQKTTGIAGYTLTYDSRGLYIVAHEPFVSLEKAIAENADIHATIEVQDILATKGQMTIRDTDKGALLEDEIHSLEMLVQAYEYGFIKENPNQRLVKVSTVY